MGFVHRFNCEDPKCWCGRGKRGDPACASCSAKLEAEVDQAMSDLKKARKAKVSP